MHSCITTLLFILATLSSARYLDPYTTPTWHIADMEPVPGCLDASWSKWAWLGTAYIFFNDDNDARYSYAIATTYTEYYPETLTNLLHAHNYRTRSKYDVLDAELCGWWNAGTARVDGRHHGSILWKYADLRRKPSVRDFHNATSWAAASGDHIPPHLSTMPSDALFTFVRDVLVDNVPNADIYYTYTTLLTLATGVLGMLAFQLAIKCFTDRETGKRNDASEADIELDVIKVHRLSGAGMQRMDMDSGDYVKTPGFTVQITDLDPDSPVPSPAAGSIADPPPIYSVDGARR